jgi:hypothetical protein
VGEDLGSKLEIRLTNALADNKRNKVKCYLFTMTTLMAKIII